MGLKDTLDTALGHIGAYDMAASNIGQAIAVQETYLCLSTAMAHLQPVAWRACFSPGHWRLFEYDPTGLPSILEVRPLYE